MEEIVRTITLNKIVRLNYIVSLSSRYQNDNERKYPLILFLHNQEGRTDVRQ